MTKFILKFKTSLRYIRDTSMYKYNNNYSQNKKNGSTSSLNL